MKDCNGREIQIGDIVAGTITCNEEYFKDPFTLYTVVKYNKANHGKMRRPKCGLILHGAYCFGNLVGHRSEDLMVLTPGINLQDVFVHFSRRQHLHQHHEPDRPYPEHWKLTPLGMLGQIVELCLKLPPLLNRDVTHLSLKTKDDLVGYSDELSYLSQETIFFAEKILAAQEEKKRLTDQRKLWKLEQEGDIGAGI